MNAPTQIHGFCDDAFLPLKEAFTQNFEDDLEWGAALAATKHGKPVVDLWAGSASQHGARRWERDTVVYVASLTKTAAILSALIAVDRGLLDLDTPIARYWPEFGQHGKDKVTVRDAFTHRTGVPGLKQPATVRIYNHWDAAVKRVADEKPWFEPGVDACYHALTMGLILGELVRRTDGRRPRQFFAEEIAEPIGAEFSIGLPLEKPLRLLSTMVVDGAAPEHLESGAIGRQLLDSFSAEPMEPCIATLRRENPSEDGVGNARGVARYCSILANAGMLDGRRFLSRELVAEATREQFDGVDKFIGPVRYGLGFGLHSDVFPAPVPTSFHWGGYGGTWVVMDVPSGVAIAYTMNRGFLPANLGLDARQARFWAVMEPLLRREARG
jgi:CubicO group peptidase (beta-lactamase class C family)